MVIDLVKSTIPEFSSTQVKSGNNCEMCIATTIGGIGYYINH